MNSIKKILIKKDRSCKSIWFMRQAGRYLPEFKKIRLKNQNFINLCLDSDLVTEITLQPIKRFDLDSAIIFSDILIVPHALGQDVNFTKNYGPVLSKFNLNKFLQNDSSNFTKKLEPIYKAINKTRKKLDDKKSLISFIGAPWTLFYYMSNKKENLNTFIKEYSEKEIDLIFEKLNYFLCLHIKNQIDAGADVIQIFDSWAGLLKKTNLKKFCFLPNKKLVEFCKNNKIPVICFPKGIKSAYLEFNKIVKPDGLNLDSEIDLNWARTNLRGVVLQGGMDPKILLENENNVFNEAKKYLNVFKDVPYIFNLGHGIVPETDPDMVDKLVKFVRSSQ